MRIDRNELHNLRVVYNKSQLLEEEAGRDPIALFELWFAEAIEEKLPDANACTLATADSEGRPSARIILLKEFDHHGFVFYTNYNSRKGRELEENPQAALCFYWPQMEKQVRIEGYVQRVSGEESEAYFRTRPRESQLGARASAQSKVVADRAELDAEYAELEQSYSGETSIPLPATWGGYRLQPDVMEFWQGRANRLHDRLRFARIKDGWKRDRLAP